MSMRHPTGADKMAGINILDWGKNSLLSFCCCWKVSKTIGMAENI